MQLHEATDMEQVRIEPWVAEIQPPLPKTPRDVSINTVALRTPTQARQEVASTLHDECPPGSPGGPQDPKD